MQNKEDFLRELGARIAAARKRVGLTQAELGQDAGISQQLIADHENGNRHVLAWQLVCTADALDTNVSVRMILNGGSHGKEDSRCKGR